MSTRQQSKPPLLSVERLTVDFSAGRRKEPLRAVNDVSLSIAPGETVGLVGESGSGKTTIARSILGLVSPTTGVISFEGRDITRLDRAHRRALSRELQVVFQDPYSSLNPVRTVGDSLREMVRPHDSVRGTAGLEEPTSDRVTRMLERVGLSREAAKRYPAHFSGGQRQRIAIARALMCEPRLLICDEPVSALDLSVQAQVLNLLRELQEETRIAYLFIAHDLPVVRHMSDRILVLYRGSIVEEGPADSIYNTPRHPYTQALLNAVPVPDPTLQKRRHASSAAKGELRSDVPARSACAFAPRCPHVQGDCIEISPVLEPTHATRRVACHHWTNAQPSGDDARLRPTTESQEV